MIAVNDPLKLAIEGHGGEQRWEQISRFDGIMVPTRRRVYVRNPDGSPVLDSMHHPYQANHGRSPSAADMPGAAVPGGA